MKIYQIVLLIFVTLAVIGFNQARDKAEQARSRLEEQQQKFKMLEEELDQDLNPTVVTSPSPVITMAESDVDSNNKASGNQANSAQEYYQQGFAIWVQTKDYQRAEAFYKKALAQDPNYAPALSSYGYIRGAFYQEYDLAYEYLQKAMKLDPDWAYAPYNMGLLYSIQAVDEQDAALHQKGIDYVQLAVDKFPDHPDRSWFIQHLQEMKRYHQERFE